MKDQFRLNVTLMHMLTGMFMMFGSCWSGGLLGQARLARTSQISSRQQNEQLVCSSKSFGIPAFVWLLRRSCPTEGNTHAHWTAMSPIILTTMHSWANPTLTSTSCHVCRGDMCDAPCISKQALPQLGSKDVEFRTLVNNNPSVLSWSRPWNIFSACLSADWHLPRRSLPFVAEALLLRLGPQPTPKCWQQWPTEELTPSRKCPRPPTWWRQTTMGLASAYACPSWK